MHECGHFLFCKLFNVSTPSFSIGFGPKVISRKIGDTQFSLGIIPLGGYVEIAGNYEPGQGEQAEAMRDDERSFRHKRLWQKLFIICGGIIANMICAYVLVIGLFAVGIPATPLLFPTGTTSIKRVITSSPAERAGLLAGDTILSFDGTSVRDNVVELNALLGGRAETRAELVVERSGGHRELVTLMLDAALTDRPASATAPAGRIGVEFETARALPARGFTAALSQGTRTANRFFMSTFHAFKHMFVKRTTAGLGGPLMIIKATAHGATRGLRIFLLLIAFISMSLAALNILPLPILDGGQALLFIVEAAIGRQLPEKAKNWIFIACWILMILLLLLLTVRDVRDIFVWFKGLLK
ncbi:MAG: M50 family metallopeptidase [Candidatus Dependentiae bacterium]|nr:M50 family metallopeptidase [Candidatus Dependentiae bacterium]